MIELETDFVHVGREICEECGKDKQSKKSTIKPMVFQFTNKEGNPVGKMYCGQCISKISK